MPSAPPANSTMPSAPPANPLNLLHPDLAPAGARFNPLVLNTMANKSPNPMHEPPLPSRKVHVVYYLSRSGQLEHPHLLEVSISPNEGLYLRDVKKRLAMIRGKRLPWTFAWSYKRSYKNGYVWQDLCDDDLIFPAHGCEYVLKGSEILTESNAGAAEKCQHTSSAATLDAQSGSKKEQGLISINPKLVYRNYEESAVNSTTLQKGAMVESGTDAATQTEEELRLQEEEEQQQQQAKGLFINYDLSRNKSLSHSTGESCRAQNATELNKADIASPPSSSSTNSPSPYKNKQETTSTSSSISVIKAAKHNNNINTAVADEKINDNSNGSKTPGRSWMKRAVQKLEKQDEIISQNEGGINNLANIETPAKIKYSSIGNAATVELEPPSARPSRGKHSGALSLLQFVSCGGLDIKEQILPMSLYRLRSKGTPTGERSMVSAEDLCEVFSYGGSEGNKSWTKLGRTKNYQSNKACNSSDAYGVYDEDNHSNHNHSHRHHHQGDSLASSLSPAISRGSAKARSASIPDVISIGRSSISDRSTNVSRELEYHMTKPHGRKLKKSGEMMNVKGSPSFSKELFLDCHNVIMDSPRSVKAVSGEIMSKGSPLFVPGKLYINAGSPSGISRPSSILNIHSNEGNLSTKLDPQKPSSTTTSRAFSEGEVSSMLAKCNPNIQSGEKSCNAYDQSMVQLWEELLAPAKEGDYQRRHGMADLELERERTLQNAVDMSLPPVELLVLQECPHCCRKVKPELLKSHMKNCSSPKSNNKCNNTNNNIGSFLGKPPKPDSTNLCQRFLRASPPPTK